MSQRRQVVQLTYLQVSSEVKLLFGEVTGPARDSARWTKQRIAVSLEKTRKVQASKSKKKKTKQQQQKQTKNGKSSGERAESAKFKGHQKNGNQSK